MMRKQMSNREYLEVKIANKCDSEVDEIRNIEWLQFDYSWKTNLNNEPSPMYYSCL